MRGPLGFIKVRTEVDDHHLRVRLSSVLTPLSRQVPLDRVRGVETHDDLSRHIPGTLRFWLVGVRIVPGVGWAISAGRRRGVTLSLDDGRRAVLGSRRPEALADAVRRGSP